MGELLLLLVHEGYIGRMKSFIVEEKVLCCCGHSLLILICVDIWLIGILSRPFRYQMLSYYSEKKNDLFTYSDSVICAEDIVDYIYAIYLVLIFFTKKGKTKKPGHLFDL